MPNKTPFLGAAFVCERIIQEKDDVLTAVRIVDTFTLPARPQSLPPDVQRGIEFSLFILLKSGDIRGKSRLAVKLRYPSGKTKDISNTEVVLEGEHRGANVVIQVKLAANEWGLHWFDVSWEDQILTSVPVRLVEGSASKVASGSKTN